LSSGVAFFAGLPFASTIRTNLSKFSNSDADGFEIVILVRGRVDSFHLGSLALRFPMGGEHCHLGRKAVADPHLLRNAGVVSDL
jgi:hypothetical protein